jgi:hypothetical protein
MKASKITVAVTALLYGTRIKYLGESMVAGAHSLT